MKKMLIACVIVMMFAGLAWSLTGSDGQKLSGQHYNLNIIGVKNAKTADMDDSSGHVIFVLLSGHSKINLVDSAEVEGLEDDFAVLDKNGTDSDGATFALPKPGFDPYIVGQTDGVDTISDYSVYVRPLGKPGGWATITTCAELLDSTFGGLLPNAVLDDIMNSPGYFGGYASVEQVGQDITMRTKGRTSFTNVTAQLLSIVFQVSFDLDGDGTIEEGEYVYVRVPIFDDSLQGEYWDYDNHNLKLLQVRFYPWGTDVTYADLLLD